MRLTTRYRFAASHRLDVPTMSREENQSLFGKCNNPYGHGHNYAVDITVEGPVDETGQVVNRAELDRLVRDHIIGRLDHKNLNFDVAEFAEVNPTTENLATMIRTALERHWNLTPRLARITIIETPKNTFILDIPSVS